MRRVGLSLVLLTTVWLATASASAQSSHDSGASVAAAHAQIEQHGYSATRLLVLGRAQRAAGELGAAIASFEQARLLEPRSPQLEAALSEARAEAGSPAPPQSMPARLAGRLSLREWAGLALASALSSSGLIIALVLSRRRRGLLLALALCMAAGGLAGTCFVMGRARLGQAVVLHDGTTLRRSPFSAAVPVAACVAGEEVTLTGERHDKFVLVQAQHGEGWVAAEALAPLATEAPPS